MGSCGVVFEPGGECKFDMHRPRAQVLRDTSESLADKSSIVFTRSSRCYLSLLKENNCHILMTLKHVIALLML